MARKRKAKKTTPRVRTGDRIGGFVAFTESKVLAEAGPTLIVFLHPWRDAEGCTQRKGLEVCVPMSDVRKVERAAERWRNDRSLSLTVTKVGRRVFGRTLRVVTYTSLFEDPTKRSPKKKTVHDRALGELEYAPDMGCFMGARQTSKHDYEVMIDAANPADAQEVAKRVGAARKALLAAERSMPKLREAIASKLLTRCNERWREGKRPVSRTAFKRELSLSSAQVSPGRTTLYLSAGDLFMDHGVEVRLTPRGKVSEILVS